MIIAVNGYGGAGKDTIGNILVQHRGFKRLAFADPLKQIASQMFDVPLEWFYDRVKKFEPIPYWDGLTPTQIAVKLGTEVGRHLHPDVWVRKILNMIGDEPGHDYVITDCRFPNEALAVRKFGGLIVRVDRDGYGPRIDLETGQPHISDIALDNWNFDDRIRNDGVMGTLAAYVCNDGFERWLLQDQLKRSVTEALKP